VAQTRQRGWSLVELLIVLAIITIMMAFAIPYFQGAVMDTTETAAIQAIHTIHTAEVQYFAQNNHFAPSLRDLAGKINTTALAAGRKGGYQFSVEETQTGYAIHAEPMKCGVNGKRSFYSDDTMIMRQAKCPEPATAESEEIKK